MINFEEIKKSPNYIKVGATEELVGKIQPEDTLSKEKYKRIIEPWLSASLQSEHLSLLLGAGLTIGLCQMAGVESSSMATAEFGDFTDRINNHAQKSAARMHRGRVNIEDQIRTALSLLEGYEIDENEEAETLNDAINEVLKGFWESILLSERNLISAMKSESSDVVNKADYAFSILQSFLFTFASRNATRERTHIFTTNYDRIIEYGCDLAGIKIVDRFWGEILPRFQQSPSNIDYYYHSPDVKNEFRYAEGVVRYSKIHGSIDWFDEDGTVYRDALRFGAEKDAVPSERSFKDHLMIYPNSMKSIETAFYPYSELFRDYSTAICRPNTTLFVYGYGFGDTHINRIIKEMLSVPSTHIVIMAYSIDDRLIGFLRSINMAQTTILAGEEFASLENLVKYYLPKAAIDRITETASKLVEARKGYADIERKDNEDDEPTL